MSSRTKITCLLVASAVVVSLWMYSGRRADAQQPFASSLIVSAGICDPHEAFQRYDKTRELAAALQTKSQQLQDQLTAKEEEIKKKAEELATSGFTPGKPEFEKMQEALLKLSVENKNFADFAKAQLQREDLRITQLGYEQVYAAVQEVAKKKQLTLVLSQEQFPLASRSLDELRGKLYYRRPVLYADKALDITNEVVELLNTRYKLGRSGS